MKLQQILSTDFLIRHPVARVLLPLVAAAGVLGAMVLVFLVVPDERVMGAVYRIFYFHVGSALTAYLHIALLLIASIFFLATRKPEWDLLGEASASVGLLFCSIVLVSGMIWGHSAWNVWWRWEPRLVSFLVLWLILFSYTSLRAFSAGDTRQSNFAAVLGILAAVNVPIVMFSVKLLEHSEQLHPQVVAQQGLRDESYVYTLVAATLALMVFSLWLLAVKTSALLLRRQVESCIADRQA
ncbi:MAG: cytochrome c biogenesis protein CcsA [Bdellovibrionales bacterium]|nr:cytochrome c biogenesis protein CcsA [Bdellovibrionales bacterium]